MMMMVMMISRSIIMMAVVSFTCPCHLYGNTLSIEERMPATSRSRLRWRLGLEPQKPQALNPHKPPQKKHAPPPPKLRVRPKRTLNPHNPQENPPTKKKRKAQLKGLDSGSSSPGCFGSSRLSRAPRGLPASCAPAPRVEGFKGRGILGLGVLGLWV